MSVTRHPVEMVVHAAIWLAHSLVRVRLGFLARSVPLTLTSVHRRRARTEQRVTMLSLGSRVLVCKVTLAARAAPTLMSVRRHPARMGRFARML